MTYKGKPFTVVTMEYLILTFRDMDYYPPKNSDADYIFKSSSDYCTDDIFDCLDAYVKDWHRDSS